MKVAIDSDHSGFILNERLKEYLAKEKVECKDFDT